MEADIATVFEKLKARRKEEKKYSMPETIGGVKSGRNRNARISSGVKMRM